MSSVSVYGSHRGIVLNERTKFKPNDSYAKSKIKCEKILKNDENDLAKLGNGLAKLPKRLAKLGKSLAKLGKVSNEFICKFCGKKFNAPNPIEEYLSYQFGDWKVRKRTADKESYMTPHCWKRENSFVSLMKYLRKKLNK